MPSPSTHKRMCNPCGIPDAKFFKDGRKSSGEPQRDQPLEGLKKTLPSRDDGQLEQMFTAHDSTMVPKPVGGRKLLPSENDGQMEQVLRSRKRESGEVGLIWLFEVVSVMMAGLIVMIQISIFRNGDGPLFLTFWSMVLLHACFYFGQSFMDGKSKKLMVSLGVVYLGWLLLLITSVIIPNL